MDQQLTRRRIIQAVGAGLLTRRMHPQILSPIFYGSGFDFYVDAVNGSDSNSGKSPATAKQTLAAGIALLTASKYRLGLARGSRWREQCVTPAYFVQVGAYGSGAQPIIDGTNLTVSGDWTKTGGYSYIWQTTQTITNYNVSANSQFQMLIFENGTWLVPVVSLAACDATPGTFYVSITSQGSGPLTLYIHPSDSGQPVVNGKTYEYAQGRYVMLVSSGAILSNLTLRGYPGKDGVLQGGGIGSLGKTRIFNSLVLQDSSLHSAVQEPGAIFNSLISYNAGDLVIFGDTGGAAYTTTINGMAWSTDALSSAFWTAARAAATSNFALPPVFGHGANGVVRLNNITCSGFASALGTAATELYLSGCNLAGTSNGTMQGGSSIFSIADSQLSFNFTYPTGSTQIIGPSAAQSILTNSTIAGNSPLLNLGNANQTVTVSGCTLDSRPAGSAAFYYAIQASMTGQVIHFQNNVVWCPANIYTPLGGWYPDTVFDSDYNTYHYGSDINNLKFRKNGSTMTFAQWQALGYDTHSVAIP